MKNLLKKQKFTDKPKSFHRYNFRERNVKKVTENYLLDVPKNNPNGFYKDEKIRIGPEYQVHNIPEVLMERPTAVDYTTHCDKELLIWAPTEMIPDIQINEFITQAKDNFNLNAEQSLAVLFQNHYDLDLSKRNLSIEKKFG